MTETVTVIDAEVVVRALTGRRFPLEDEKRLQVEIESVLRSEFGHLFWREVRLTINPQRDDAGVLKDTGEPLGIIDFTVAKYPGPDGMVGIEVKIGGQPAAIERQLRRYARHPLISALVLVTSKSVVLPPAIDGKPLYVVNLGRAWL